ncbi:unnamed protein product, partial [Larinioides sclopetarius]
MQSQEVFDWLYSYLKCSEVKCKWFYTCPEIFVRGFPLSWISTTKITDTRTCLREREYWQDIWWSPETNGCGLVCTNLYLSWNFR